MDTGTRPSVTFETEVQRQHPRIRIPATLKLDGAARGQTFRIIDLSAGGFSFDASGMPVKVGQRRGGIMNFDIKPLALGLPVRFEVRHLDPESGRCGCRFDDLGAAETAVLRQLISAYLGGELVVVGEMLATLSRDAMVPSRREALANDIRPGPMARTRAVLLTALMFAVGTAAFAYAAFKLYTTVFVTQATAAKVAAPSFTIAMPRDGTFFSLVPDDGIVKKGQPLGSFQAAMLDVLQGDPGSLHLTPAQMSDLMGETLKGTLSSPCDCKVQQLYATDTQFVNRNQPLMDLMKIDSKPYVLARFHFDATDQLTPGRVVTMKVSGESDTRRGTIRKLRLLPAPANPVEAGGSSDLRGLNGAGAISDVLVEIEPSEPLKPELLDRPVTVSLGDPRAADFSFQRLRALLPSAAAAQ